VRLVVKEIVATHRRHPVMHALGVGLLLLPVFVLTLPVAILAYPALLGLAFASAGAPAAARH
jgi:hypothetical protein